MSDEAGAASRSPADRAFDQLRAEAKGHTEGEIAKARVRVSESRRRRRRAGFRETFVGVAAGAAFGFLFIAAAKTWRPDLLLGLDIVSFLGVSVVGFGGALIAWTIHREQDLTADLARLSPQFTAALRCGVLTYVLEQQITQYLKTFDSANPADIGKEVLARLERWDNNVMCEQAAIAGQAVPELLVEMELFVTGLARAKLAIIMAMRLDDRFKGRPLRDALVALQKSAQSVRKSAAFAEAVCFAQLEDINRGLGTLPPEGIGPKPQATSPSK